MKRLLAAIALITLVGAGCAASAPKSADQATYVNSQYGFAFDYPKKNIDVHVREDDVRQTKYLGLDADFFASVRDIVQDPKNATTLAYLYAIPHLTLDQFKAALESSDPSVKVKEATDVKVNGINMTKVVTTTAAGADKTQYYFVQAGTAIIASEFLLQEAEFEPVLHSFRPQAK